MSTSMHENHCVIQGSLEEMGYKALFKKVFNEESPNTFAQQKAMMEDKVNQLKAQNDALNAQKIKDMEALQAEYLKYEELKKVSARNIKYIPIFQGEEIQDVEVIVPNCAHLKTTLENNPFTNRTASAPISGTSITTASELTRIGFEMPVNAIYKVKYDSCTMTFDSSNKIMIAPQEKDGRGLSDDKIQLFQKHVLASVISNPDAPIKLSFPKSMDETEKFRIINEMIVAYMSVTGTKGEIDSKGSEARREQFIKNLLEGGTIDYMDTISIHKGERPNIFTGGGIKDLFRDKQISNPSTQDLVKEYQNVIKQLNRQDIMMDMLKHLEKSDLDQMVAGKPWEYALATREMVRSGTNAVAGGLSTLSRVLGAAIPGSAMYGANVRNDVNDKWAPYSREGIDEAHKRLIKACMADMILNIASASGFDNTKPIKENQIEHLPSFQKLNDPKTYNMQAGEVLAFLNSPEVKHAMQEINQPTNTQGRVLGR